MAGSGDLPALGAPGMNLPIGMTRRAFSYDDNMEAPMSTPPHDGNIHNIWRRPVIPARKFAQLAEEDQKDAVMQPPMEEKAPPKSQAVVKAKASSVIMNSLITKQIQDSVSKFELTAGLSDTGYTPHRGLTAQETRHHHRMPESLKKMQIQGMEGREEKSSLAQSNPSSTPPGSPKQFNFKRIDTNFTSALSRNSSISGEDSERFSVFDPTKPVPISEMRLDIRRPASFAVQAYHGAVKPTPMELMKAQTTRPVEKPDKEAPPKMEIPNLEGRRAGTRPHKLKPRDLNVLTPSGF